MLSCYTEVCNYTVLHWAMLCSVTLLMMGCAVVLRCVITLCCIGPCCDVLCSNTTLCWVVLSCYTEVCDYSVLYWAML